MEEATPECETCRSMNPGFYVCNKCGIHSCKDCFVEDSKGLYKFIKDGEYYTLDYYICGLCVKKK
jgi:hypothetical protein